MSLVSLSVQFVDPQHSPIPQHRGSRPAQISNIGRRSRFVLKEHISGVNLMHLVQLQEKISRVVDSVLRLDSLNVALGEQC